MDFAESLRFEVSDWRQKRNADIAAWNVHRLKLVNASVAKVKRECLNAARQGALQVRVSPFKIDHCMFDENSFSGKFANATDVTKGFFLSEKKGVVEVTDFTQVCVDYGSVCETVESDIITCLQQSGLKVDVGKPRPEKATNCESFLSLLSLKHKPNEVWSVSWKSKHTHRVAEGAAVFQEQDDRMSQAAESVQSSTASWEAVKCFLPNTAFPTVDGHLLLVQNLQLGCRVKLASDSQQEATVVSLKVYTPKKRRPYDLIELVTRQGSFRLSAAHCVVVPHGDSVGSQRADTLKPGDMVIIGSEKRRLTKVNMVKERTQLFMVEFDPDAPIEMFPVSHWGMQVWGEPADRSRGTQLGQAPLVGLQLLQLAGIPNLTESELLHAEPPEYSD